MLKVVHFVESFSVLSETFIYHIVTSLEKLDSINYVVTINKEVSERPFDRVIQLQKKFSFRYKLNYQIKKLLGQRSRLEYLDLLSVKNSFEDHIQEIKPDCLVCHFAPLGIITYPIAQKFDIPLITICYGYDISKNLKSSYWKKRYTAQFDKYDALIGISNHICNKLKKLSGRDNVFLMHLGVDSQNARHTYPSQRLGNEVVFIHIGRLVEKKGIIFLLKAFQIALKMYRGKYNLKLKVVGDGPLRSICDKFIRKENLDSCVEMLGALPHHKALSHLTNAHIYTQHSITAADGDEEGQGVSLVEASSLGLPVVATLHNGFPDVIANNSTGFLVPEKDYYLMGEKMAWLADNPELWDEIGSRAVRHIVEKFSVQIEVARLRNIINNVKVIRSDAERG